MASLAVVAKPTGPSTGVTGLTDMLRGGSSAMGVCSLSAWLPNGLAWWLLALVEGRSHMGRLAGGCGDCGFCTMAIIGPCSGGGRDAGDSGPGSA